MKKTSTGAAVILLMLTSVIPAHAEDVDYDKEPVVDWKEEKNPLQGLLSQCTQFDDGWGSPVCRYEETGFTNHYKKQKQEVKSPQRDRATPRDYCGRVIQNLLDNQFANGGAFLTMKPVRLAFKAKVKTVTCQYDDDSRQSPSIRLTGNDLVIRVRYSGDASSPTKLSALFEYSEWYKKDLAKAFPEFRKAWNDSHSSQDQLAGDEPPRPAPARTVRRGSSLRRASGG